MVAEGRDFVVPPCQKQGEIDDSLCFHGRSGDGRCISHSSSPQMMMWMCSHPLRLLSSCLNFEGEIPKWMLRKVSQNCFFLSVATNILGDLVLRLCMDQFALIPSFSFIRKASNRCFSLWKSIHFSFVFHLFQFFFIFIPFFIFFISFFFMILFWNKWKFFWKQRKMNYCFLIMFWDEKKQTKQNQIKYYNCFHIIQYSEYEDKQCFMSNKR